MMVPDLEREAEAFALDIKESGVTDTDRLLAFILLKLIQG